MITYRGLQVVVDLDDPARESQPNAFKSLLLSCHCTWWRSYSDVLRIKVDLQVILNDVIPGDE
jgi:hypothetical protein